MRGFGLAVLLGVAACTQVPDPALSGGVAQIAANYPPLIIGANTRPASGNPPYARSCPPAGSVVEQKGGPTFQYLGASPRSPDLCRMRVGNDTVEGWYGIWLT